ncbi:MAG: hypothetical protein HY273_06050 [Gammaproteobacteria bacterium]|nr:hypothetical protein [Gammaproteobacteria bacterium]
MSTVTTRATKFGTHTEAVHAVNEMQRAFFERKRIPVVSNDDRAEGHVTGHYNLGNRIKRR